MKNILLITTGGTIASGIEGKGLHPKYTGEELIEVIPEVKKLCNIYCKNIMNIDSVNIQPQDWVCISKEIFNGVNSYDGVILTHGTDTMAYTSSMLSFMLRNVNKPVILTGSQIPIIYKETDGKKNLYHSFLAANSHLKGVNIVFNSKIIKGSRAFKMRTANPNAYASRNYPYVGKIRNEKITIYANSVVNEAMELDNAIDSNVFLIKLFPGVKTEYIECLLNTKCKGVVIEAFGAGGIPHVGTNLLEKVKQLTLSNIPVVITSQCIYDGTNLKMYNTGIKTQKAGVISGHDMTTEAAITKLMWVLGHTNNINEIRTMMLTNYNDEIMI